MIVNIKIIIGIRLIYYFMFLNTNETNLSMISIQNNSKYRNVFLLRWYFLLIQYAWHNIHSFCSFCAHLFYEKQKKSTINRFARTKCCHAVTNSYTRYFSFHQNVVVYFILAKQLSAVQKVAWANTSKLSIKIIQDKATHTVSHKWNVVNFILFFFLIWPIRNTL